MTTEQHRLPATEPTHYTARSPEVVAFAGSRGITGEEALAMFRLAGTWGGAHRIWESPAPAEKAAIRAAAPDGTWGKP